MFLSQITMPYGPKSTQFDRDVYQSHQMITLGVRKAASMPVRFRVEPTKDDLKVLVLSHSKPDWTDVFQDDTTWLTKDFEINPSVGDLFQFRLRANTVTCKTDKKGHHTYAPVFRAPDLVEWISNRAERCGFAIESLDAPLNEGRKSGFRRGEQLTFQSALFGGLVRVTDVKIFLESVYSGIGRSKGFGFGLFSVIPVDLS